MKIDWSLTQQVFTTIGIAAVVIGYAWGQFTKGRLDRRKDDMQTKKDVFDLLQEQVNELTKMVDSQKSDIIRMQAQIEEKDKKVKEYIEIMQNRNPEMLKFMNYLTYVASKSEAYMKDTGLVFTEVKKMLGDISEYMERTNEHLEGTNRHLESLEK